MNRVETITTATKILAMIDGGTEELGPISWEADIGRFIDQGRFEHEKQKLFLERPQLIAMSADLPEPDSYYAVEIAGKPILLTRDKNGVAHAFLNACRHRGVQLAEGCGHASRFTCPYHAWTFAVDGQLLGVPQREVFDADQLADRNLIALPICEHNGMIIVHPQPDGKLDRDEFLGAMGKHLDDYDLADIRLVSAYKGPARINWKHAVDGGVEGYHVPFLHSTTVGPMTLNRFLHIDHGLHHILVTTQPQITELRDMPIEDWPEWCHFSLSHSIFPNTVLVFGQSILAFQRSEPGSKVGECDYSFRIYGWDRNASEQQRQIDTFVSQMLLKVALEEDMKVQTSSQVMMEAGAVPNVLFGRKEVNVINMHKNYDALAGYAQANA